MNKFIAILWFLLLHSTNTINAKPGFSTETCSSCEKLVQLTLKANQLLDNKQVHEEIVDWCVHSKFGDDHNMCEFLLNNTLSSLSKVDSKRFCYGIDACRTIDQTLPKPVEEDQFTLGNSSIECEFCLNTLTHVKEIISSPATVNEIKSILSSCCSSLKELKNECLRLVDGELDTIFQFIRDEFDPRKFCIETQACPSRTHSSNTIYLNLPRLSDFIKILPRTSVVVLEGSGEKISPKCLSCHFVYEIIDAELKENKKIDQIGKILDTVGAEIFNDSYEFSTWLNRFSFKLINLASSGVSTEVACLVFDACQVNETSNRILPVPVLKADSSNERDLCNKFFQFLYNDINGDRTQKSIEKALVKVCGSMFTADQLTTRIRYADTKSADLINNQVHSNLGHVSMTFNSLCEKCKIEVQKMISYLAESQKFLIHKLESICGQLETTTGQCSSLMVKVNATFNNLQKDIVSQAICSSDGTCSYGSNKVERNEFSVCSKCQTITRLIEEKMSDYQTEQEIAEFIRNDVCGQLPYPVLKETCQVFMAEYGDLFIYKIVLKMFDSDLICSKELHVCPSTPESKLSVDQPSDFNSVKGVLGPSCDLCVNLVTKLESLISSTISHVNLTDDQIISRVCSQFSSQKEIKKCKIMYDTFGSHFIQMIGFNEPKKICSVVDICSNENSHLLGGHKCTFGPTYWCHTLDHANACKATNFCEKKVWKTVEQNVNSSIKIGPQCVLCHLILKIIDKELKKNRSEEQIEAALDNICRQIYRDKVQVERCQERVAKYTKSFIDMTTHGLAPHVICMIFALCPFGQDAQKVTHLQNGKVSCPFCKLVVENIYRHLTQNETRENIEKAIENACKLLPGNQKQECLLFIATFDAKLAQLIAEVSHPDEVCENIGLCFSFQLVTHGKLDSPECVLCEQILEFVYSYLQGNRTIEAINDALDKVCDIFAYGNKKSCRKFVDAHTKQVIDIVLQTADPKEACTVIGLCKHKATRKFQVPMLIQVATESDIVPLIKLGPKAFKKSIN